MDNEIRPFMGHLWYQQEDGLITVGISEEALEDFSEISAVDLPRENEELEADVVCGTIDTDQGPLDLYVPVSGKVVELNAAITEEPTLIMDDPTGDGWLFKIEASEEIDEEDEDDSDDEDEDEDDEEENWDE